MLCSTNIAVEAATAKNRGIHGRERQRELHASIRGIRQRTKMPRRAASATWRLAAVE